MADIYVFIGPPGAGKGTVGEMFCEKTKAVHVSTGDILRQEMAAGSELGNKVKGIIAAGGLVSDDIVAEMVENRLKKDDIVANGCLLDGFPRTVPQAEALKGILQRTNHRMAAVVLIEADNEMLITRLTSRRMCSNKACGAIFNIIAMPPKKEGICDRCGAKLYQRTDDTREAALNRLEVYAKQTAPLIDFYEAEGNLVRTTSTNDTPEVNFARLLDALKK